MNVRVIFPLLLASAAFPAPALARPDQPVQPASLAQLAGSATIPYETFTLPNGLRVVVNTDRKAPVVAVSVWYGVGSKHEPKGKTGFAHLFEHLMFNGSENAPGDFLDPMEKMGATNLNGGTSNDFTAYFETVPREALARTLFLESDRMGHLLGAMTQEKLDAQRGVVQNEKRQYDNQPYALAEYRITAALYPPGHPYAHMPIGSMADLDKAGLDDVKAWFHDHYGPNNAVLALSGDVDVATARELVTRYFGDIPAGPHTATPAVPVPTLPAPVSDEITDRVAAPRIERVWAIPGTTDPGAPALTIAASVLGKGVASRLREALMVREHLASSVNADADFLAQGGTFKITLDLRPGVDPALASARLDAVVAAFLRDGATREEVAQRSTRDIVERIKAADSAIDRSSTLGQGLLVTGDAGFYRTELERTAKVTPAQVRDVARTWLGRPAYTLVTKPGERPAYEEAASVAAPPAVPSTASAGTTAPAAPAAPAAATGATPAGTRGAWPEMPAVASLAFPAVERATLSNGIGIVYARRPALPVTYVSLVFDAGRAADPVGRRGLHAVTTGLLDKGTATLDAVAFARRRDLLGMEIGVRGDDDTTEEGMNVPSVNLAAGLALFSDMVRAPRFDPADFAHARDATVALVERGLSSPIDLSLRASAPRLYGPTSPYGRVADPAVVKSLTLTDVAAFRQAWLRPDKARIYVVSDRPLAEVREALDSAFGNWSAGGAPGRKDFPALAPVSPRIVLVDLPGTPQSLVAGFQTTPFKGRDDILSLDTANEVLGGSFMSRVNIDLRETRGWTYGAIGRFQPMREAVTYSVSSPVQADKTGASITALRDDITQFNTTRPMTQEEFDRTISGSTLSLSGRFETSSAVLGAIIGNDQAGRPDDYSATLAARYRAMTLPELAGALKPVIDPARMFWVVVGDAKTTRPQLDGLGLPVEVVAAKELR